MRTTEDGHRRCAFERLVIGASTVGALLTLMACGADEKICTAEATCTNMVSTTLTVARSRPELDGARLELCRNEQDCITAVVNLVQDAGQERLVCNPGMGGPEGSLDCSSSLPGDISGVTLVVSVSPSSQHDLADGDRFTVRVTDVNASIVWAEKSGSIASYKTIDGGCVEGYFCRQGSF
ncbi:hypothetical protein [Labilithrix luteola]|nr:hypothetical protein [Labilithrix luteola]